MSPERFSKASTIFVSVPSKLNLEQTHDLTKKLLGLVGCPTCFSGFRFNFIEEEELISARVSERGEVNVVAAH